MLPWVSSILNIDTVSALSILDMLMIVLEIFHHSDTTRRSKYVFYHKYNKLIVSNNFMIFVTDNEWAAHDIVTSNITFMIEK